MRVHFGSAAGVHRSRIGRLFFIILHGAGDLCVAAEVFFPFVAKEESSHSASGRLQEGGTAVLPFLRIEMVVENCKTKRRNRGFSSVPYDGGQVNRLRGAVPCPKETGYDLGVRAGGGFRNPLTQDILDLVVRRLTSAAPTGKTAPGRFKMGGDIGKGHSGAKQQDRQDPVLGVFYSVLHGYCPA